MKTRLIQSSYPPPPPPPPPSTPKKTGKGMKKGLIAIVVIVIVLVATIVPLFALNIISLGPKASPSPSSTPTASPTPTAAPTSPGTSPTLTPSLSPSPTPAGTPSTVNYGVLIGTVADTNGDPLAEVTVSIGGKTGTTNAQGWFSISNISPGTKQVVKFTKAGFASTYQVANIVQGISSFVKPTLKPVDKIETFDATQGATVTSPNDNSYVTIDPSTLVTKIGAMYQGMATLSMTSFDPSDEDDANAFPGEYIGQAENGTVAPIKSFGFMDVTITDPNGEELQLASGESASISIQVPTDMQSEASTMGTCPLWYFDNTTGMWIEEGQGTYNATTESFEGSVSHFSTWNYDIMYPVAYISGRVVNSNGVPVQGAQVKCWGTGWYMQRWASGETTTNDNGVFIKIPVEVGVTFKYQASKGGHESAILQTGPLTKGEERNVGDIVLDAPLIQITLTWGADPRDLDSHLAANLTNALSFHVYYYDKGTLTSSPYANLDTDERYSYGPEIVSISKLQPGIYRYSVRHFAGSGNISTSGAEVNLVVPGVGIYRYTPPATQATGTDIWRVFDIVINSSGQVTAVNTINDYVTGDDESTLLYP